MRDERQPQNPPKKNQWKEWCLLCFSREREKRREESVSFSFHSILAYLITVREWELRHHTNRIPSQTRHVGLSLTIQKKLCGRRVN